MKKLLSIFGAIGLVATSSSSVVSCFDIDYQLPPLALGDFYRVTNIGAFSGVGDIPTFDEIYDQWDTVNKQARWTPEFEKRDIKLIGEATTTNAKLEALCESDKCGAMDSVDITYIYTKKINEEIKTLVDSRMTKEANNGGTIISDFYTESKISTFPLWLITDDKYLG